MNFQFSSNFRVGNFLQRSLTALITTERKWNESTPCVVSLRGRYGAYRRRFVHAEWRVDLRNDRSKTAKKTVTSSLAKTLTVQDMVNRNPAGGEPV